jgi:sialic acid synthase SpsE
MRIILDFGSANTCNNDKKYIKRIIDELAKVDKKKHNIVIKWQLWSKINPQGLNERLTYECFDYAYNYAKEKGYQTTASVFDLDSLEFLLEHDIPFVKIANRRDLYPLIAHIPRDIEAIVSYDNIVYLGGYYGVTPMYCISKYPADIHNYDEVFYSPPKRLSISDHTKNLFMFKKQHSNCAIWEMHYALSDSTGLDAESGVCKTPEMLQEIL